MSGIAPLVATARRSCIAIWLKKYIKSNVFYSNTSVLLQTENDVCFSAPVYSTVSLLFLEMGHLPIVRSSRSFCPRLYRSIDLDVGVGFGVDAIGLDQSTRVSSRSTRRRGKARLVGLGGPNGGLHQRSTHSLPTLRRPLTDVH